MSIALIVTRGYGNGTLAGDINDVVVRGYTPSSVVDSSGAIIADAAVLSGTGTRAVISTGAISTESVVAGIATRIVVSTGVINTESTVAGLATSVTESSGNIISDNSIIAAIVSKVTTATGAIVASDSTIGGKELPKVTLDPLNNSYGSTSTLNNNLNIIEDELNNKILYRDNPSGEPNQMESELDMNSNRLYNLPDAVSNQEPATFAQLVSVSGGTTIAGDGEWDGTHLIMGAFHFWMDGNDFRGSVGAPTSATDGAVIATLT